jgi:hypothetical protein
MFKQKLVSKCSAALLMIAPNWKDPRCPAHKTDHGITRPCKTTRQLKRIDYRYMKKCG